MSWLSASLLLKRGVSYLNSDCARKRFKRSPSNARPGPASGAAVHVAAQRSTTPPIRRRYAVRRLLRCRCIECVNFFLQSRGFFFLPLAVIMNNTREHRKTVEKVSEITDRLEEKPVPLGD